MEISGLNFKVTKKKLITYFICKCCFIYNTSMVIYDSFVTSVHIKHVSYISPDVAFKDQQDICLELKCSILVIEYNHSD